MNQQIVLLLHGLGGEESSMKRIGRILQRRLSGLEISTLRGTFNYGDEQSPCWGWFEAPDDHNRFVDGDSRPKLDGLRTSVDRVQSHIDQLVGEGWRTDRIHLVGHSQGGAVAMATGLTYPETLGSINSISGYLAIWPKFQPSNKGNIFLLQHCRFDDNVSYQWANYALNYLRPVSVLSRLKTWEFRSNPHGIHLEYLTEVCENIECYST